MNRRDFIRVTACAMTPLAAASVIAKSASGHGRLPKPPKIKPFEWEEAGISELQSAFQLRRETAASLAKKYIERIEEIDQRGPRVNSVIELNPDALSIAKALDKERKEKGPRSPLHGIPILLKDNIDTRDRMMTTAGSLALVGSKPARDAFLVKRLREAGALILGKTNLSEWANFRGDRSSSGWSARGGQTNNPFAIDRNPSGSSSGSAAAVSSNLCAAAIGTETDGSIISPSTMCGIVGLKPTVGLISRSGIIPISHNQDTAGPMTRTVRDAAIMLTFLTGIDARDEATEASRGRAEQDYTKFLDPHGLRGARLGIARGYFRSARPAKLLDAVLGEVNSAGAVLIDITEDLGRFGANEREVLLYDFKAGLNQYIASLGPDAPVRSLQDVIEFNERNKDKEMPFFGQELMLKAQEKGPLTEKAYLDALAACRRLSRDEGIDAVMARHKLDAIVAPSGGPGGKTDWIYGDRNAGGSSSPAAVAGYPNITVPAGFLHGMPFGISFFGKAYSEPALLKVAYAFEQATKVRRPPRFVSTLG